MAPLWPRAAGAWIDGAIVIVVGVVGLRAAGGVVGIGELDSDDLRRTSTCADPAPNLVRVEFDDAAMAAAAAEMVEPYDDPEGC